MSFAGKFLYQAWHRPRGWLERTAAAGGPIESWRTDRGRQAMTVAAAQLPLLPPAGGAPLTVHLLTGRRFWYQTAFCLWTLARQTARPVHPIIYDDGSLQPEHCEPIQRLFPQARFESRAGIVARLDEHLPVPRFPALRERWLNYPNIRKLTDVHVGRPGWKLVLDSDLLFFHHPSLLVDWLDRPDRPLHAVDSETSYGYTRSLMNELAGAPVADLINVGLTGLDGSQLDWEKLEHWCATLIAREGTHYFLEQALIAMLVAGRPCAVAPAADYITCPAKPESDLCRAVMHHYVANSKASYFRTNWRRALQA